MKESRELLVKELMRGLDMNQEIAEEYAKYLVSVATEEYKNLFQKTF